MSQNLWSPQEKGDRSPEAMAARAAQALAGGRSRAHGPEIVTTVIVTVLLAEQTGVPADKVAEVAMVEKSCVRQAIEKVAMILGDPEKLYRFLRAVHDTLVHTFGEVPEEHRGTGVAARVLLGGEGGRGGGSRDPTPPSI